MARGTLSVMLSLCLLANAFCLPTDVLRYQRDTNDNLVDIDGTNSASSSSTADPFDDDDDDFDNTPSANTPAGSSIFSLLNLVSALFPSSSSSNSSVKIKKRIQNLVVHYQVKRSIPRRGRNNVINTSYATGLKHTTPSPPHFGRQVSDESSDSSESESISSNESGDGNDNASVASDDIDNESTDDDKETSMSTDNDIEAFENDINDENDDNSSSSSESESDENNAAEESAEQDKVNAKQSSDSNGSDSEEDDYSDEPPGGDGQGGGILGLLAGLSGGEDGESDLGSLLAAVSGIVVNLSGDGFDLNSLIASALGLFAGLLSEGEENPGSVVASYLLTSLDTITGGGAKNNGAFFGNFISKLLKGTSAAGDSESSEESNENKMTMADSAGFIISLLMSILGDMSKGSSGGSGDW